LNVLFFGTPAFAVPTLQRLLATSHRVVGVVTQPDKPAGRGRKMGEPAVKVAARDAGIEVHQPASVRGPEFLEWMKSTGADVAIVVAYGKILPKAVLEVPKHGCLNIHGSVLPAYRGAAPIQWAIINGEEKTGISIMQMDVGMDTGAVIAMREVDILDDDDTRSLGDMLSYTGADLMMEVLEKLAVEGRLESTPQDHSKATKAPMISREMAEINWTQPSGKVICAIHGFYPWPKAFTLLGDREIKITNAEACAPDWVPEAASEVQIPPGAVVEVFKGRGFAVRCGKLKPSFVLVTRVQPADRPEMSASDFLNGGGVDIGKVFGRISNE